MRVGTILLQVLQYDTSIGKITFKRRETVDSYHFDSS